MPSSKGLGNAAGIRIIGLNEFRSDARRALGAYPRELSKAVKRVGMFLVPKASGYAPTGPSYQPGYAGAAFPAGSLKAGYKLRVRGGSGQIYNAVPYAAGAEWGTHGKWAGFTKYPSYGTGGSSGRGRFAWRAVAESEGPIAMSFATELDEVFRIYGWGH